MFRRRAAGEPGDRQIHRAPEEVDRADLAHEPGPEFGQDPIRGEQLPPEQVRVLGAVGCVLGVGLERDGALDLPRLGPDGDLQVEFAQRRHGLAVELGDRFRRQGDPPLVAAAGPDVQLVFAEVELDVERTPVVRDQRGGQAACGDVERDLPPVVDHRRHRQSDLAHDLSPHVQRVAGIGPLPHEQRRPFAYRTRALLTIRHRWLLTLHRSRRAQCAFLAGSSRCEVAAPDCSRWALPRSPVRTASWSPRRRPLPLGDRQQMSYVDE